MAIDLEEVPNTAPGQPVSQVVPPTQEPNAGKLTPEQALALNTIPGVNQQKAQIMQQDVADRQPVAPQPQTPAPQQQSAVTPANPLGIAGYLPGTSSSTTSQVQLSKEGKEAAKKADEAAAAEIDAARRQSEVTQQKTEIQAQEARTVAQQTQNNVQALQTEQAERAKMGQQHLANISQAIADFKATKIDPDHWWNSRTTGQKIRASIASALDVMGAAWSRSGRTPTADAIQHAIDRDIEGQKMAMDAKARGVQMAETAYSAARAAGADDALAKATVRQASLDATMKDFQAMLDEKTLGPEQKAAADMQLAQLEHARQQNALQIAQLTAKHVSSTSSRTPITNAQLQSMQQGTGSGLKGQDAAAFASDVQRMAKDGKIIVKDPQALTDALKLGRIPQKVVEQLQGAMRVKGLETQLVDAINKYHDSSINSEDADKYQTKAVTLVGDLKGQMAIAKGSALTAEEAHDVDQLLKPPSRSLPSIGMSGVKTARESEIAKAKGAISGVITPLQGNLEPFGITIPEGSATAERVQQQYVRNGRVYLHMQDGSWRDGGAAP
jgi:hypothetical protein